MSGGLAGHVYVADSMSAKMRADTGVIVTVLQINRSTKSDSSGAWNISNLPIGSYDVIATKPGFGTMKWFEQKVVGPGTYYCAKATLGPTPQCSLKLESSAESNDGLVVLGKISNCEVTASLCYSIDKDSTTLPNEPHFSTAPGWAAYVHPGDRTWSLWINNVEFNKFSKGDVVYISVYPTIYNSSFQYPGSFQSLPISPGKKSNCLRYIIQ